MQSFLDSFFFFDRIPGPFVAVGNAWGVDIACLCALPNFFNVALHFILVGFLLIALARVHAVDDRSFVLRLLVGFVFSGISKLIDWSQNMFTATGDTVFWSNNLDILIESFQLIGLVFILWAIFIRFKKEHTKPHTAVSTNRISNSQ